MSESLLEPQIPKDFETLEAETSSALLNNDGVLALVTDHIGLQDPETKSLPNFKVRVHYPSQPEKAATELGLDHADYISLSLQVGASGQTSYAELPGVQIGTSRFSYVNLGVMKNDGEELFIYDEAGRLHEVPRGEDGRFEFRKDSPCDMRRAKAIPAWQNAHNAMLRAARTNPEMHIDLGVWTTEQNNYFTGE